MVEVARRLREDEKFGGYIHLKTIPECSPELIEQAGLYADRLSINVELPTDEGVKRLAPEKRPETIRLSMARLRRKIEEKSRADAEDQAAPDFAPAGQSTQMIIGADATTDDGILRTSARLYGSYHLRRVYYSAFSPIPDSSKALPLIKPPLMREHRLYQADWLMRFYGFCAAGNPGRQRDGMLDLAIDPKLAWALRNRGAFPGRRQPRRPRSAVARSGPRHEGRRAHSGDAAPSAAAAGRRRPAVPVDRQGAAVHHRRGLVAGRADRRPSPARQAASPSRNSLSCFDGPTGTAPRLGPHGRQTRQRDRFAGWRDAARRLALANDRSGIERHGRRMSNAQESLLAATEDLPRRSRRCQLRSRARSSSAPRRRSAIRTPTVSPSSTACCGG